MRTTTSVTLASRLAGAAWGHLVGDATGVPYEFAPATAVPGDVAFALTTSGRSPNVLKALAAAKERGLTTVFLTGERGRGEAARWDVGVVVPSAETAHVQEIHLAVIHAVCRAVDESLAAAGGAGSATR